MRDGTVATGKVALARNPGALSRSRQHMTKCPLASYNTTVTTTEVQPRAARLPLSRDPSRLSRPLPPYTL